ncbi:hypothetical protein V6N12_073551 [Hibiscus sabdariffa]|uniref:BZIP domain-containing protein n=1 Tax=Hibiscus sabdariffa TaxID=183260 RepID=A0ABR2BHG0_9ROSI
MYSIWLIQTLFSEAILHSSGSLFPVPEQNHPFVFDFLCQFISGSAASEFRIGTGLASSKERRRMESNRDSARRSRMRKQKQLGRFSGSNNRAEK